jgi:hypothetical protein
MKNRSYTTKTTTKEYSYKREIIEGVLHTCNKKLRCGSIELNLQFYVPLN